MMNQNGKVTIIGLITLVVVIFGGFCAVKLISAGYMEKQIEKEVVDSFGLARGADFTAEKGMDIIAEILASKGVVFNQEEENAMDVYIEKGQIHYYFRYKYEVDLIVYVSKRVIEVENVMQNY